MLRNSNNLATFTLAKISPLLRQFPNENDNSPGCRLRALFEKSSAQLDATKKPTANIFRIIYNSVLSTNFEYIVFSRRRRRHRRIHQITYYIVRNTYSSR